MKQAFSTYVTRGDYVEEVRNGITYRVRVEPDIHASIDDDDVHPTERPDDVSDETWEKIQAARAAWFRNEWHYVGLVVSAERDGWERDHVASLWGLEANYPGTENEYLNDVATELIEEAEAEFAELQYYERGEHDGPLPLAAQRAVKWAESVYAATAEPVPEWVAELRAALASDN